MQFNGISYSGEPFVYCGERAIVDLDNVSDKEIPILLEHNREKRLGFGYCKVKTQDGGKPA